MEQANDLNTSRLAGSQRKGIPAVTTGASLLAAGWKAPATYKASLRPCPPSVVERCPHRTTPAWKSLSSLRYNGNR